MIITKVEWKIYSKSRKTFSVVSTNKFTKKMIYKKGENIV